MASKKTITVNPLLALFERELPKTLTKRPEGALTRAEICDATKQSEFVIRKRLAAWRREGRVQMATVREPGSSRNLIVYWEVDSETYGGFCDTCGALLDIVRPGKWQCPKCG